MIKIKNSYKNNYQFIDSSILNDATYIDYLNRFKKICLSLFEWVNLPKSMNQMALEKSLYYHGTCALFYDKNYGYINTNCASSGKLNIYGLPTELNCYSFEYNSTRSLYTGLKNISNEDDNEAILVLNNYDMTPTSGSMELFAYRLYLSQRTADINIIAQKTPVLILVNEKQRLLLMNLYNQYNGNQPFIFGDTSQFNEDMIKSINTGAPFIADKLIQYKKDIWEEALTFLGINSLNTEKKERLITDETNANNELINLNLQSFLIPRQEACKQFNEKFNLTNTDREISVRVRSDLYNIIKKEMSIVSDFNSESEVEQNGKIFNRTKENL